MKRTPGLLAWVFCFERRVCADAASALMRRKQAEGDFLT